MNSVNTIDVDKVLATWNVLSDREKRVIKAKNDIIFFGEYYIKPYDARWNCETADFHREMLDFIEAWTRVVIHIPFEHAKSTWISIVYPLWLLINDHNHLIALISATIRQAEGFLSAIKWHIENNRLLHEDFPELRPSSEVDKWAKQQIFIQRSTASPHPSIQALGCTGSILSARLTRAIGDDIVDRKKINTPELRDKIENWWLEDVVSRLYEDGKAITIGSLQHHDDLNCRLSKNPEYKYLKRQALIDEDTQKTLWPQRFPYVKLEKKRREMGTIRFNRLYQNDMRAELGNLLRPQWLNYYKETQVRVEILHKYLGVDPALLREKEILIKDDPDYFVIACIGLDYQTKLIYLLDYMMTRVTFPDQIKLVGAWNKRWKPMKIGIENNAYQDALRQQAFLLNDLPPVVPIHAAKSKTARFQARSVDFENGRIWIKEEHKDFINQWINYPDVQHDDVLDAVDIACSLVKPYLRNSCEVDFS